MSRIVEAEEVDVIETQMQATKRAYDTTQGHLMQMTIMVPPFFPKELQYLNKEDRLLRWLLVKHRNTVYGLETINDDEGKDELNLFGSGSLYRKTDEDADADDDEDDDDDDDEEYEQE